MKEYRARQGRYLFKGNVKIAEKWKRKLNQYYLRLMDLIGLIKNDKTGNFLFFPHLFYGGLVFPPIFIFHFPPRKPFSFAPFYHLVWYNIYLRLIWQMMMMSLAFVFLCLIECRRGGVMPGTVRDWWRGNDEWLWIELS